MTPRQFPPIIERIEDLQAALGHLDARTKVIAFDLFDAVLERNDATPDDLRKILARRIMRTLLDSFGIHCLTGEILQTLQEIEAKLASGEPGSTGNNQHRLAHIARALAARLTNDNAAQTSRLTARIIEHMRAVEAGILSIKPGMAPLLSQLNRQNTRIIALSDITLDPDNLQSLFKKQPVDFHFDDVYIAPESDTVQQYEQFFKQLLQQENLQPHELLLINSRRHTGNRLLIKTGISAICFEDTAGSRHCQTLRIYRSLANENPYWRGRHLLQLIRPAEAQTFHYDYGYEILGPIFAAFILGVIEEVKKNGIQQVFFLAREGELFMKLFERLCPDFFEPDQMPIVHYLHVSRRSTAAAAAHRKLSHEMAITPLFNPRQQGLLSICQAFGLPAGALMPVFQKHGYHTLEQPVSDWESAQFQGMLNDPAFQHIVQQHTKENWRLLHRYLEQQHFFSEQKIAIVDIGWNGTTQKFLQDAFGQEENYPHVMGLYFGFTGGRKYQFDTGKNTLLGILCDERHKARPGDIFSRFEEIFEEGARALHPTTIGYQFDGNSETVVPIFKQANHGDRQIELAANTRIADFHAGILAFAAEFARAIDLTGYRLSDIKPFILTLAERAVAFPAVAESHQLMQLQHSEDFGSVNVMNFQQEKLSFADALLNPGNFLRMLKKANWKYGAASTLGIPGLNAMIRLYDLLKSK